MRNMKQHIVETEKTMKDIEELKEKVKTILYMPEKGKFIAEVVQPRTTIGVNLSLHLLMERFTPQYTTYNLL